MSDNANAVGSITVNQAAQSFASMLDSQEGVDTGAEAQPEEEQSESESEEMEGAEPQDEAFQGMRSLLSKLMAKKSKSQRMNLSEVINVKLTTHGKRRN